MNYMHSARSLYCCKFQARRGNHLDQLIKETLEINDVKCPVIHLHDPKSDNLYLVGNERKVIMQKSDQVVISKGGGHEPFDRFIVSKDK